LNRTKLLFILLAVVATSLAVFWQETNLNFLQNQYPSANGMLTSADEASYFAPPTNLLAHGEWKDNSIGLSSYIQRPPGYGIIYLFAKTISPSNPYLIVKWIQIFGFFCSILLFASILRRFVTSSKLVVLGTVIYGMIPCFSGFMYFTITEGVTPFLLLLSTYFWLRYTREEKSGWQFILSNAFMLLVRPQLLIFSLLFVGYQLFSNRGKRRMIPFLIFVPLLLWLVRTISIQSEASMHPIYSSTNTSIYRPPHAALTNLFRIWESDGERFHESVGLLVSDTSLATHKSALQNLPEKYRDQSSDVLREFQMLSDYQISTIFTADTIYLHPREKNFIRTCDSLTQTLAMGNLTDAYVLKSASYLLSKSHLNLAIFQGKFRGHFLMEILRYFCVGIIALSFVLSMLIFFVKKNRVPKELKVIGVAIAITFIYLIFVQRLNEERYLTPMLPLAFMLMYWNFTQMLSVIRSKRW
jgi:hypothetical protein